MASYCDNCGEIQYRRTLRGDKFIGTDCGCLHLVNGRNSCQDPFAGLVLEHVKGDDGKPMRFENLRQVAAFEQRTGMVHALTSYNERWMPNDWTPPTMPQLMRPQDQRERGRGKFTSCVDGHGVVSGNGFTARVRRG